jgi:hypothetical protein
MQNDAAGGYGVDIRTVSFSFSKTFIVPTMTSATLVYGSTSVYTQTTLDLTLVPSFAIPSASEIRIDFPFLETSFSLHFISSTGSVGCLPTAPVSAGVSCTYSASRSLATSGAFVSTVAAGTSVKLRVSSIFTPLSATPVVSQSHQGPIYAYLQDAAGVRFMQSSGLSVSVTTPLAIPAFTPSLSSNLVGATSNLQMPITFSAPFLPGSIFTLIFTNFDASAAAVVPSSSTVGSTFTRTATSLVFNLDSSLYSFPVALSSLTVQNLINNVPSCHLGSRGKRLCPNSFNRFFECRIPVV